MVSQGGRAPLLSDLRSLISSKMVSPGWGSPGRGCHYYSRQAVAGTANSAKGPVSRILSCAVIPLGAALPRTLISDLPGGSGHTLEQPCGAGQAPSAYRAPSPRFPPYLVLLRVGFTLPPALPPERCALTAPFHPYPGAEDWPSKRTFSVSPGVPSRKRGSRGGIFSVALAVHEPSRSRPGRYPAHCPAEFGLSSPEEPSPKRDPPGSDRPVLLPVLSLQHFGFTSCGRGSWSL